MANRGRGRGRGFSFNVESLGFGHGETLPSATVQPPDTFPVSIIICAVFKDSNSICISMLKNDSEKNIRLK